MSSKIKDFFVYCVLLMIIVNDFKFVAGFLGSPCLSWPEQLDILGNSWSLKNSNLVKLKWQNVKRVG